jgi:hypothetical protein
VDEHRLLAPADDLGQSALLPAAALFTAAALEAISLTLAVMVVARAVNILG